MSALEQPNPMESACSRAEAIIWNDWIRLLRAQTAKGVRDGLRYGLTGRGAA